MCLLMRCRGINDQNDKNNNHLSRIAIAPAKDLSNTGNLNSFLQVYGCCVKVSVRTVYKKKKLLHFKSDFFASVIHSFLNNEHK